MHPELIKALLRMRGVTPAAIADELGVSRMTVSHVIHSCGTSMRIAERISTVIGKPLSEIWPGKYAGTSGRSLRRQTKLRAGVQP